MNQAPINENAHGEIDDVQFRNPVDAGGFAMIPHVITLDRSLGHGAYRLYALLLKYAQQKGQCWSGVEKLADDLGKGKDTVSNYLGELVKRGLITRERRMGRSTMTWIEDVQEAYPEKTQRQLSEKSYGSYRADSLAEEEEVEEEKVILTEPIFVPVGEEFSPRQKITRTGHVPKVNITPLSPSTPGAAFMFAELAKESHAKGHRAPRRFNTLAQKEMFENAEDKVGEGKVKEFITKALAGGIPHVKGIVFYVNKCVQEKPRAKAGEVLDAGEWCEGMQPRLKAGETLVIPSRPPPTSINPGG